MKVAFLDRDGTIINDYPDDIWSKVKHPQFFSDTFYALKQILYKNYKIIILTNQYIIGEGFISFEQYNKFTDLYVEILKQHSINIFDIFYCPHKRQTKCSCKKPKKGMITAAMKKYPNIDLSKSFIAGDSTCDEELARLVNVKFFKINYQNAESPIVKLSNIIDHI